jgi:hypothetical protein
MDRIRREQTTAVVSDQLAQDIVAFCNTRHVWKQDLDHLNKSIAFGDDLTERFFVELNGNIEMRVRALLPKPPPAPLHMDFRAVCQALQPDQRDYDFWLSWMVEWLAQAILAAAPEASIRDAALKKASSLLSESFAAPRSPIRHLARRSSAIYRR